MASLASGNVTLLRCETNQIATLVNADLSSSPDGLLPILTDTTSTTVDDTMLDAVRQVAGTVLSFWEVQLVTALGTYADLNATYKAVETFTQNATYANLAKYGDQIILLLAAAGAVRNVTDACNHAVTLGGLVPPDPAIASPPDKIPAPPQEAPYHRTNVFGPVVLGTMAVGTAVLGAMALGGCGK